MHSTHAIIPSSDINKFAIGRDLFLHSRTQYANARWNFGLRAIGGAAATVDTFTLSAPSVHTSLYTLMVHPHGAFLRGRMKASSANSALRGNIRREHYCRTWKDTL